MLRWCQPQKNARSATTLPPGATHVCCPDVTILALPPSPPTLPPPRPLPPPSSPPPSPPPLPPPSSPLPSFAHTSAFTLTSPFLRPHLRLHLLHLLLLSPSPPPSPPSPLPSLRSTAPFTFHASASALRLHSSPLPSTSISTTSSAFSVAFVMMATPLSFPSVRLITSVPPSV